MSLDEKLVALYRLDQQVRGLRSRSEAAAQRLKQQKARLERLLEQRDEIGHQHRQSQAAAMNLENEVRDIEARISRFREQMNAVKSNKEYSALLIEVNTFKLEKSKVEDQALVQMTQSDELAQQLKQAQQQVDEQAQMVKLGEKELEQARAEVAEQLEKVTKERDAAEAQLGAEARAMFQKAAELHDGETLAPIIEESRRHMEYTCGGCYMSIPAERVNALMASNRSQVVCCPSCGRILYIEADLRAALGIKQA